MSLTKIDREFTFVGTRAELAIIFDATDTNVGAKAVILVVPDDATFEQRKEMAQKVVEIRSA